MAGFTGTRRDELTDPLARHLLQLFLQGLGIVEYIGTHAGLLPQLFAKCENFRILFARGVFQKHHQLLHRKIWIVAALDREKEHLPEKILGPPIVVEDLHIVGGGTNVLGHSRPIANNRVVAGQADRNEQNLRRHGACGIDVRYCGAASLALSFEVARSREEDAVHVESVFQHGNEHQVYRGKWPRKKPVAGRPVLVKYWFKAGTILGLSSPVFSRS